jgi:signal transduction histidine kinase
MIVAVSLLPILGAILCFGLWILTLTLPSRRTREGVFLGLVNLCTGFWLLSLAVQQNLRTWFVEGSVAFEQTAVFWFVVGSFASVGLVLYWFLFAAEGAGYRRWTTGAVLWVSHAVALLVALAYATAPIHDAVYTDFVPGELTHTMGPLQPVLDILLFVWIMAALAMIVSTTLRTSDTYPGPRAWAILALGGLALLLGAVLRYGIGLETAPIIGLFGPLLLPLVNTAVVYYVFRAGMLEFAPVSAGSTFRSLADGVIVADYAGRVASSNEAALSVFPDVGSAESVEELLLRAGVQDAALEAWDRDSGELLEFETVTAGRPFWVRVAPMSGRYRWQTGTLVMATDISRLRGAEREVREANRQLVEAEAARERFLRNVGRELRSPIETIIGMSDVLLQQLPGPINEEQRSQLTLIQDSGNRLLQVFDRILYLAAAQDADAEIHYEDIDICVLVEDVTRSLRPTATRKSLQLAYRSNRDHCRIRSDIGHLRSILDNLISNAIEYTDEGTITVTTFLEDTWVEIDVADTGRGIPAALQERVFEEFGHAEDEDPGSPETGARIGLALSRQLARRLGGDITVESTPGIGSRFRLWLPLIEA